MTTFRLIASDLLSYEGNGGGGYSVAMTGRDPFPARVVEAKNVAELVPLMDAYAADATASGLPLQLYAMLRNPRDRAPNGFDRARAQGGPLMRFVNVDKCPEVYR